MNVQEALTNALVENSILKEDNSLLKEKLSGICEVYKVLRPVLQVLKFFSFVKKGGKKAIEAAIAALDVACDVK